MFKDVAGAFRTANEPNDLGAIMLDVTHTRKSGLNWVIFKGNTPNRQPFVRLM